MCPSRKAWLDARDAAYRTAYDYGQKANAAQLLQGELDEAMARVHAMEARQREGLKKIRELTADLIAEMTPKPSWWKRALDWVNGREG